VVPAVTRGDGRPRIENPAYRRRAMKNELSRDQITEALLGLPKYFAEQVRELERHEEASQRTLEILGGYRLVAAMLLKRLEKLN
jgi:hypothetical protein